MNHLTIDDFFNPMFDRQRPVLRKITHRNDYRRKEKAIVGVTFTDNYLQIGYTYCLSDGMLYLNYWDERKKENVRLFEGCIDTPEDFEKRMKQADKKIEKKYSSQRR